MRVPFAIPACLMAVLTACATAPPPSATVSAGPDFGDDSGEFAKDGECDDPRFAGPAMVTDGFDSQAFRDATDCRAGLESGGLALKSAEDLLAAGFFTGIYDGIDFGDNSGVYARDDECDDPRFKTANGAPGAFPDHEYHDAADCRDAYASGTVTLLLHGIDPMAARFDGIDFGNDSGEFPRDGVCDDPRFAGPGMGGTAMLPSDVGRDARDCLAAWMDGDITLAETED